MAYRVPREMCTVCHWSEDEHDPDDWQAFAPWNYHLLCASCYDLAMEMAYTSIPNPEEQNDPETIAAIVEAALMAYVVDGEGGDEESDSNGDDPDSDAESSDADSETTLALY